VLAQIDIRNLALVDRVGLELEAGLSVLTGETGAGKSILIDAVSLVIGERANAAMVREGAERAEVVAVFELTGRPEPTAWLLENELDHEGECILRRTIAADGRSRAFINDRPVSVQNLRSLGELLVDIHGQHAHQSLLRRDTQRNILDEHGGHQKLLATVSALHKEWAQTRTALEQLSDSGSDVESRVDFLQFQLDELAQHEAELSD
jgi:DNA repair protein RecN (Recombination protein N)